MRPRARMTAERASWRFMLWFGVFCAKCGSEARIMWPVTRDLRRAHVRPVSTTSRSTGTPWWKTVIRAGLSRVPLVRFDPAPGAEGIAAQKTTGNSSLSKAPCQSRRTLYHRQIQRSEVELGSIERTIRSALQFRPQRKAPGFGTGGNAPDVVRVKRKVAVAVHRADDEWAAQILHIVAAAVALQPGTRGGQAAIKSAVAADDAILGGGRVDLQGTGPTGGVDRAVARAHRPIHVDGHRATRARCRGLDHEATGHARAGSHEHHIFRGGHSAGPKRRPPSQKSRI